MVRHFPGNGAVALDLGKVPDPAQHTVGDAGGAPGAAGDLHGPLRLDGDVQDPGAAGDDQGQLLRGVQLQPQGDAEAVPQWSGQLPGPGGGSDEGKLRQVQPDGIGGGALADDDVERVVLHCRIENLLYRTVEAMNLVNKQNIIL